MANSYLLETLRGTAAVNRLQIVTLIGDGQQQVVADSINKERIGGGGIQSHTSAGKEGRYAGQFGKPFAATAVARMLSV